MIGSTPIRSRQCFGLCKSASMRRPPPVNDVFRPGQIEGLDCRPTGGAVLLQALSVFFKEIGGHLNTGHRWPLQNRLTKPTQNISVHTLPMPVVPGFCGMEIANDLYCLHLGGGSTSKLFCQASAAAILLKRGTFSTELSQVERQSAASGGAHRALVDRPPRRTACGPSSSETEYESTRMPRNGSPCSDVCL